MEKRFDDVDKNEAATTTKRKSSEQSQSDDCGQIDNIIGSFGKYQFLIFLFKILIGATSALNNLGVTFYAPTDFISFWCADANPRPDIGLAQNYSTSLQEPNISSLAFNSPHYHNDGPLQRRTSSNHHFLGASNLTDLARADLFGRPTPSPPPSSQRLELGQEHAGSASRGMGNLLSDFLYNDERHRRRQSPDFNSDTPRNLRKECSYRRPDDRGGVHKCTAYKYDTGIWMSTIIDEWDLVCDRSLLVSITQSLYMAGFIVSYLMFGYISDRFGRWRSLLLGALIEVFSGFGCAFSSSVIQFMMFRFLLGLGNAGRSSSSYLIMIEWTGQSWRMPISTLGSLGWVLSYCAMPWISLYFLHFRHMQLFVCFYELAFIIWLLRLPESPRWLLTHKRFDEAHRVLLNAARFNGLIKQGPDCGVSESVSDGSSGSCSKSSSNDSIAMMNAASLLKPNSVALRKLDPSGTILTEGSFARKRLNSISANASLAIPSMHHYHYHHNHNHNHHHHHHHHHHNQHQQATHPPPHESIILAPNHEVAAHVEVPQAALASSQHQQCPFGGGPASKTAAAAVQQALPKTAKLQPYTLAEFDRKFAQLAGAISQKEFTKNEDRLSIVDLFRWRNLRRYTFILAFAWACNSFIYYGIALRVGDFGGKNLFVSFSFAGATELPSLIFTILFMKFLPRKTTNILMFSTIFAICALQAPLRYYQLGWLQQTTMILAKLFNSCSFICILYQTMELFPTSIRQTAYSSCSLAGRIGSILAPFIKELSQLTNTLVPPIMYATLSLIEILFIRHLPETQGADLPDTLMEAEKFKGTSAKSVWGCNSNSSSSSSSSGGGGNNNNNNDDKSASKSPMDCLNGNRRTKLPPA